MTATECIAGDGWRSRRMTQSLRDDRALGDEDAAACRLELHPVAHRPRNEGAEARPACGRCHRILCHHEDLLQTPWIHIGLAPEMLRRELLYILDASLGHLLRRQSDDLEPGRAAIDGALQVNKGLRFEAVRLQAPLLTFCVGRAEAHEMHAGIARH